MPFNLKFHFIKHSKYFTIFSLALVLIGIVALLVSGLKYGVDFRSGSSMDINTSKNLDDAALTEYLTSKNIGNFTITHGAERITIRFEDVLTDVQENEIKTGVVEQFDNQASAEVFTVDVEIARELQRNALVAILLACLGIMVYVSIRFEWRFAMGAIVSMLYDAFIVIAMFSLFRMEVNLPFIIAVLTVVGYSINDTIVIFDRIRENLRFAKIKNHSDLIELVNRSIWETVMRSINTVVTVLFAAICLFIFGSESIRLFSLAMIIGLISGAYSSIFIASQVWLYLKKREKPKVAAKSPATSQ